MVGYTTGIHLGHSTQGLSLCLCHTGERHQLRVEARTISVAGGVRFALRQLGAQLDLSGQRSADSAAQFEMLLARGASTAVVPSDPVTPGQDMVYAIYI